MPRACVYPASTSSLFSVTFTILSSAGELVDFTYTIPVAGSNAPPPQLAPPFIPGSISVPCMLGGV